MDLRKATHLVLTHLPIPNPPSLGSLKNPGRWENVLNSLGLGADPVEDLGKLKSNSKPRTILTLKDEELKPKPDAQSAVGRRLLVNVTPLVDKKDIREYAGQLESSIQVDDIKPFDLLQSQSQGIHRLGVLRMDVDNLGKLFSEGLGNQASLSRVAALSFAVSLYFEGWVAHLAAEQNRKDKATGFGERLYSIYSGGDDLFIVGSWDAVVELARQIRADLSQYAASHPGIHASAGIALVGGKYPLSQAGEDAGRAEEQAKRLRWLGKDGEFHSKDSFAFLGQALPWEQFGLQGCEEKSLENTHAMMHLLKDIIDASGAARSILRRLIALHGRYEDASEKRRQVGEDLNRAGLQQILWGPWMWQGYYFLKRSKDKPIQDLAEQLKNKNFSNLPWIGLAARWAELSLRGKE